MRTRAGLLVQVVAVLLVVVGVRPAAAQAAPDADRYAVDASYDFLFKSTTSILGAHLGVWRVLTDTPSGGWRGLGELGFTHFDFGTVASFQGGARYVVKLRDNPRVQPFVQAVVGIEHCCGESDLSFQPGGGIFYAYSDALTIIAQIDFRHVSYDGGSDNHQRYSVGVSIPIRTK